MQKYKDFEMKYRNPEASVGVSLLPLLRTNKNTKYFIENINFRVSIIELIKQKNNLMKLLCISKNFKNYGKLATLGVIYQNVNQSIIEENRKINETNFQRQ